jgi:hypothetical protein
MPGLEDLLKLLGLGGSFIYAAAAFGFFYWLDKEASDEAKDAVTRWFNPKRYDKTAVAAAIVEVFDRIFTRPLLSWRAFGRSAIFTCTVICIFLIEFPPARPFSSSTDITEAFSVDRLVTLWFPFVQNLFSDYISLFAIRKWLLIAGRRPILALFGGIFVGFIVIVAVNIARAIVLAMLGLEVGFGSARFWQYNSGVVPSMIFSMIFGLVSLLPAFAVHLWLPLFAVCMAVIKGMSYLAWWAHKMEWFLRDGSQRPLQAVGYVAAAIVFVSSAAVQIALK